MDYAKRMALVIMVGIASIAPLQAQASDGFFYAGASIARAENGDADIGWKVLGGYQITPEFALESGYVNFGTLRLGNLDDVDMSGFFLTLLALWPINEDFSLHASLGAAHTAVDLPGIGTERGTDFVGGFGGSYRLTWELDLRLDWERYSSVGGFGGNHVNFWAASLVYKF